MAREVKRNSRYELEEMYEKRGKKGKVY